MCTASTNVEKLLPPQLSRLRASDCRRGACGACLLDLRPFGGDAEGLGTSTSSSCRRSRRLEKAEADIGLIDSCTHTFHARCIEVWAKVENSCPQCRLRFCRMATYDSETGVRKTILDVESRDQVDWEALDEGSQSSGDEDAVECDVCHSHLDGAFLLLCDGQRGRCRGARHTYCDGLGRAVPRGRWFCHQCRGKPEERQSRQVASRQRGASSHTADPSGSTIQTADVDIRLDSTDGVSSTAPSFDQHSAPSVGREIRSNYRARGRGRGRASRGKGSRSRAVAVLNARLHEANLGDGRIEADAEAARVMSPVQIKMEPASPEQLSTNQTNIFECQWAPEEREEDELKPDDACGQHHAALTSNPVSQPSDDFAISPASPVAHIKIEPPSPCQQMSSRPARHAELPVCPEVGRAAVAPPISSQKELDLTGRPKFFGCLSKPLESNAIDLDEDSDADEPIEMLPVREPSPVAASEPVEKQRQWFLLRLPQAYEIWAKRFHSFASTYLLLERGLQRVARTADRLWQFSGASEMKLPAQKEKHAVDSNQDAVRKLMSFARDTFHLYWSPELDPTDHDPCSLRCLRTSTKWNLCVSHNGSKRRMRPSDIVRGELQFRRRLLQHLDAGASPDDALPLSELPPSDEAGGGTLAAAARVATPRATAALATATVTNSDDTRKSQVKVDEELLEALKREPWYCGQIVHVERTPPQDAIFAPLSCTLDPRLNSALAEKVHGDPNKGLRLYVHQAKAIDAALLERRDIVLSTSTGSGKSLVYLAAIFESLLKNSACTAICIFPTKALAQDQLSSFRSIVSALVARGLPEKDLLCVCLDGDTNQRDRARARREARVLLTNPDMLHSHVLPRHMDYARILSDMRYIVLDEVHVYRGAFGAHTAQVLRRLRRLARLSRVTSGDMAPDTSTAEDTILYGDAHLQFVACSATVANSEQHVEQLIGPRKKPPLLVCSSGRAHGGVDGCPSGGRLVVLWNPQGGSEDDSTAIKHETSNVRSRMALKRRRLNTPPAESVETDKTTHGDITFNADDDADAEEEPNATRLSSRSPIVEVARLVAWLVARDFSVLAFCKWRSLVEIILQDVQEALSSSGAADRTSRVVSYRAGYPADLRRDLERRIFTREALGVACTNALELGVDIGRLDCTISLGFPGSVASLRQQFGRAGRAGLPGISFLVAFDDPTDQHFMRHPRELLQQKPEAVALSATNPMVLRAQLPCAAAEHPLGKEDLWLWMCSGDGDGETDAEASWARLSAAINVGRRISVGFLGSASLLGLGAWEAAVQHCVADGTLKAVVSQENAGNICFAVGHVASLRAKGGGVPLQRSVSIRAVEDRYEVVVQEKASVVTAEPHGRHDQFGGFLLQPVRSEHSITHKVIDEIDASKAFYSLFPGAVYRCRGQEYHITDLDLRRRRALACKCEAPLPYYTRAFDSTVIRIHTREQRIRVGGARAYVGQVQRESRVKSFRKYWKAHDAPQENEVDLDLPSWGYVTRGLWFELSASALAADARGAASTRGTVQMDAAAWTWAGAHAAMHALLRVLPLFVLAERADLDAACADEHGAPPMDRPRLLVFDAQGGGLGLCDAAFPSAFALLREARRLVEECNCSDGCPSCVVDANCREYNKLLSKEGALNWLRAMEGEGLDGGAADDPDSESDERS